MKVLTALQIKSAEENAVRLGMFSYAALMKRAGDAAANEISERYDVLGKRICVMCGSGNNGGDGLVIAANLRNRGADVTLLLPMGLPLTVTANQFVSDIADLRAYYDFYGDYDIIVDALFGIGLSAPLAENISNMIERINAYRCTKVAIDVPSGVFCDGGDVISAFKADLTLTFTAYKPCQLLPKTAAYCGETVVLDIGLKTEEYAYLTIDKPEKAQRSQLSHKGSFGTALLFCGSYGMCGAEILAAKAALRSGVGIVKALVCDKNYSAFTTSVPEAVTIPVDTTMSGAPDVYERQIFSALSSSNALLIGCGLGRSEEAVSLVKKTLEHTQIPTVIDADGINAIVGSIECIRKINAPVILTPHLAEMARLCNATVALIEANPVTYAKRFATENNCIIVLKGHNTVVATPNGRVFFNTTGNDGLATGGSGDVLAGMIVSRLAQQYDPLTAVLNSVYLHGEIADILAENVSTRAILPTDIIEGLKTISD